MGAMDQTLSWLDAGQRGLANTQMDKPCVARKPRLTNNEYTQGTKREQQADGAILNLVVPGDDISRTMLNSVTQHELLVMPWTSEPLWHRSQPKHHV